MPTMSRFQAAFCRSRPWRALSGNAVLPWSLQEFEPHGDVLEIGAGSGAMAAELLARYDQPTMTVTDFDQAILTPGLAGLVAPIGRIAGRYADAIRAVLAVAGIGIAVLSLGALFVSESSSLFGFTENGHRRRDRIGGRRRSVPRHLPCRLADLRALAPVRNTKKGQHA